MPLALRPVALEAENLVQLRRQHKNAFIISQYDLGNVLFFVGKLDSVMIRLLVRNLHAISQRLLARMKRHRAASLIAFHAADKLVQLLHHGVGVLRSASRQNK
ncbi:hypothetical protein D3C85_1684990 [compost metagenome]